MIDLSIKSAQRAMILTFEALNASVGFLYRMPTTEESREYRSESFRVQAQNEKAAAAAKAANKPAPQKIEGPELEYGLKILEGIRDGDFCETVMEEVAEEGKPAEKKPVKKPISSDLKSPDFRENWKELLRNNPVASQIVKNFSALVFDGIYVQTGAPESVPFVKS